MVKIYSRINCRPCIGIKHWLSQKGIQFQELDADEFGIAHSPTIEYEGAMTPVSNITQVIRLLHLA